MKLVSGDASPFAARVRLAIYAHDLPVEIVPPPEDLSSAEFLKVTPLGRIPCLEMDSGEILPESETILEYLADTYPSACLRPSHPETTARDRLLSRLADLYVVEPGMMLREHMDPSCRDMLAVDAAFSSIERGLGYVEHFMQSRRDAELGSLFICDCTLVSMLFLTELRDLIFRRSSLEHFPRLSAYWQEVKLDRHVMRVIREMETGLNTLFGIEFPNT